MKIQMPNTEIFLKRYSMISIILLFLLSHHAKGQIEIHFKVIEETVSNSIIGNIHQQAFKQLGGSTSSDYSYKPITDIDPFILDLRTYDFKVAKRLDREALCKSPTKNPQQNCQKTYKFIQTKISREDSRQSDINSIQIILVHVEIIDINDNAPKWSYPQFHFYLPEHSKIGTEISLPLATDPDQPPMNTTQKYVIGYQSLKDGFLLKHTGRDNNGEKLWLMVNKDFDREIQSTINVKLKAYDGGPQPLHSQLDINISLTDINDKQPQFKRHKMHKTISENIPLRTLILQLEAYDEDESNKQSLRFQFDNSVDEVVKNRFYINPTTGEIFTAGYIDYETKSEYSIPVLVTDGTHFDRAVLTIEVKNVNDNHPEITVLYLSGSNFKAPRQSSQYRAFIAENKDPGFVLASLSVSDKDSESKRGSNQLDCKIEPNRENLELKRSQMKLNDHFQIVTTKRFDREEASQYFIQLICFDSDSTPLSTSVTFEISIIDVNDNPPVFEVPFTDSRTIPSYSIKEGAVIGTTIIQVKATDRDIGNNANIQYSLDSMSNNYFSIDPITGELRNSDVFDFEKTEKFEITINASNPIVERKNSILLSTLQKITVNIEDVNDCPPVFTKDLYTFSVKEGPSKDVFVGKIDVKDDDTSAIYNINYFRIISNPNDYFESSDTQVSSNPNSDPSQYFRIGETGYIYVNVPVLDREKVSSFSFKILAADRSEKPLSSTAIIQIQIVDVNDNSPTWIFPNTHSYTVNVSYQEAVGHCIAQLKANDPDLEDNGKVSYRIVPSRFSSYPPQSAPSQDPKSTENAEPSESKFKRHDIFDLDSSTGNIYIAQKMTINDVGLKAIWVEASDHGTPELKTHERLLVYIINTDNNGHGSSQGQLNKRFGLTRAGFENDLMIMIVLVAIIILVAMVMVIIILMLRCRNTGRLLVGSKMCQDTCQSISASRSFLERRPDGHSCSPINDICPPYPGPKRSQTISTYLGQSAGSSQLFDLANGYMTDPNSRMQLDGDTCDPSMCHSMNRIPISRVNNSTFAKKYYTSSALYRPNALWSDEGSPELSKRLCQKLNNNLENTDQSSTTSPIHSEPSDKTNERERGHDFLPGNSTKKSITLPNFLTAIEECEDSAAHHMMNDEPQFTFHQFSNYDKNQQRLSVTWLDKFNNESTLNSNKKQGYQYKSADSCLNGPYLETPGSRDHEYTQLNVLPNESTPVKVTHMDYPVTYV